MCAIGRCVCVQLPPAAAIPSYYGVDELLSLQPYPKWIFSSIKEREDLSLLYVNIWKQYIVSKFMKKAQYMYFFIKATIMTQFIDEYFL